ncbi:MAG: O-antigen ligase family protein [Actinomycetota bacterium]|nr:O-antigen ligase family protein [Actinomycetota bacterium]
MPTVIATSAKGEKVLSLSAPMLLVLVLAASSILRGAYYPIYQHIIFMLTVVLFIAFLNGGLLNKEKVDSRFFIIWAGSLALVSMLSILWSSMPFNSISSSFIYIAYFLFLFVFSHVWQLLAFKQKTGIELWLLVFAIIGGVVSATGIIGFILQFYPWAMAVGGVVVAASCIEYPNGLAVYVLMTLGPTLYLRNITPKSRRRLLTSLSIIQIAAILLSFSKTGFLFLIIIAGYMITRLHTRDYHANYLKIVSLLILIITVIFLAGVINSGGIVSMMSWLIFDITPENIVAHRLATWEGSFNTWLQRPWLGWGIGNYDLIYPKFALDSITRHAHNLFLHIGVELGLLGIVILLLLYVYCTRLIFLSVLRRDEGADYDLRMVLSFSCLVFLVSNLWDFTFYIPAVTLLFLAQAFILRARLTPSPGSTFLGLFKP